MRKELRNVDISHVERILKKCGYKRLDQPSHLSGSSDRRKGKDWRKGRYHIIVQELSGKIVLGIHEDQPHHVGVRKKGRDLQREMENITKKCNEIQRKRGPPMWG